MMYHDIKNFKSRFKMYFAGATFFLKVVFLPSFTRKNLGKTRVLVFHHLDEPKQLDRVFFMLMRRYNIISFDQYLNKDVRKDRINVIISFDDGYQSWHRYGKSLFQKYGLSPLLFVNSNFMDLDEVQAWEYCTSCIHTWPEKSLTWREINDLKDIGAEIGGHSSDHVDMISTNNTYDHVFDSVRSDREEIEKRTGHSPRLFAYPFGRYNDVAKKVVEESGYGYAFTSDSGFLDDRIDRFTLKRTNVGMRPPFIVDAMVDGWYDHVTSVYKYFKHILMFRLHRVRI